MCFCVYGTWWQTEVILTLYVHRNYKYAMYRRLIQMTPLVLSVLTKAEYIQYILGYPDIRLLGGRSIFRFSICFYFISRSNLLSFVNKNARYFVPDPMWWRELIHNARLSVYRSIYVPALTFGHELWIMIERTRLRVQAAGMSFDEASWGGSGIKIGCPFTSRPRSRPRTPCCSLRRAGRGKREVWAFLLNLLPLWLEVNRWMDGRVYFISFHFLASTISQL